MGTSWPLRLFEQGRCQTEFYVIPGHAEGVKPDSMTAACLFSKQPHGGVANQRRK
jgi:hypothetical protein